MHIQDSAFMLPYSVPPKHPRAFALCTSEVAPNASVAFHRHELIYLEVHGELAMSGVVSKTIVITHIRGLITPLITTHEPPSIHPKP